MRAEPYTARMDDPSQQGARERRIARNNERELVRSALRAAAAHGYYVFDELVTEEAGTLDYLVVGPPGVGAVVVRYDEGTVIADPETHELYLNGYLFEDDPRKQMTEQADDVMYRLTRGDVPVNSLTCFTRAELRDGGNPEANRGMFKIWNLAWAFDDEEELFNPADVAEIAADVERIYSRPPFVRPSEPYGGSTI